MIITKRKNEYLIDIKDFTVITSYLGLKYKEATFREHIKKGLLDKGEHIDGIYGIWVNSAIYNAVFDPDKGCNKCKKYENTLENIKKICTLE